MDMVANNQFQIFTLSKEESNCPLIPQILQLGKNIYPLLGSAKERSVLITMPYGKRIISSTSNNPVNHLSRSDFIEIVDYDPIRNILLFIGPTQPDEILPVHCMIHKAKQEILIAVSIKGTEGDTKLLKNKDMTVQAGKTHLETVKNVLKALQKNPIVHIQETGTLITGKTIADIDETICVYLGKKR